jgi:TonB family protein
VKSSCVLIALVLIYATTSVAEEEVIRAYVVDGETDRIPMVTVAPQYPHKARRDRVEGEVRVCFDVDRAGRTRRIAVRNSSNRAFEKPSIAAVRASTFYPLARYEPLQSIKSCRTFIFSLVPADDYADAALESS